MSNRLLTLLQEEEPNYHPLLYILRLSKDGEADLRLQLDCHRTISKYVEAERKAVEVKSVDGENLVNLSIVIDK